MPQEQKGEIMNWISNALSFILESLLQEIVIVVAGVLFAQLIQRWWNKRKYGNWRVVILKEGKEVLDKGVSSGKSKAILEVPEDMGVFLKGLTSPFGWINCDLMDEGPRIGLLKIDKQIRRIIINLDKNPKAPAASGEPPRSTDH